mmetsp:Transcript_43275/g.49000  ORF Transcript_43275/g.49000 Transcript_43275/m.49000 type:complete len:82 (+) Transcript_43275:83-328(+)
MAYVAVPLLAATASAAIVAPSIIAPAIVVTAVVPAAAHPLATVADTVGVVVVAAVEIAPPSWFEYGTRITGYPACDVDGRC